MSGEKDDLPIFRPRIGGGRKPSSSGGVKSFRNAILSSARVLVRRKPARHLPQIARKVGTGPVWRTLPQHVALC